MLRTFVGVVWESPVCWLQFYFNLFSASMKTISVNSFKQKLLNYRTLSSNTKRFIIKNPKCITYTTLCAYLTILKSNALFWRCILEFGYYKEIERFVNCRPNLFRKEGQFILDREGGIAPHLFVDRWLTCVCWGREIGRASCRERV